MTDSQVLARIPTAAILASPDQNRETFCPVKLAELAASIAETGLLQPVTVRRETDLAGERFVLVAGERRLRACRDLLGWAEIPAIVTDDAHDEDAIVRTLVENLQRVDTLPLEDAKGCAAMRDRGYGPTEIGRKLGKRPEWVTGRLALLELVPDVAHFLASGDLPIGRAVLMASLDANRQRLALAGHQSHVTTDVFAKLVARLADEQSADTMFDTESFLRLEEYVAEAERIVELEEDPVIQVRETPLGIAEIAQLLEVRRATVDVWRNRGIFPDPDGTISGSPYWWQATVMEFAERTNRLPKS